MLEFLFLNLISARALLLFDASMPLFIGKKSEMVVFNQPRNSNLVGKLYSSRLPACLKNVAYLFQNSISPVLIIEKL